MANIPISNDIVWTKIKQAINGGNDNKRGARADQASKLLATKSIVDANGPGVYSASDIRKLSNDIDYDRLGGEADNGYMPGDILNGIYSGAGGFIDDLWDRSLGKVIPGADSWLTGEDVASGLDIATDIGLSLLGPVGWGAVLGKNLLQNTRNFSDALSGYNSTTGEYMTPDQQFAKLAGTTGTVAMSALPFGLGKIGKVGAKAAAKATAGEAGEAGAKAVASEADRFADLAKEVGTKEFKESTAEGAAKAKEAADAAKAQASEAAKALEDEAQAMYSSFTPGLGEKAAEKIGAADKARKMEASMPTGEAAEQAYIQEAPHALEEAPYGFINVERNWLSRLRNSNKAKKDAKDLYREKQDAYQKASDEVNRLNELKGVEKDTDKLAELASQLEEETKKKADLGKWLQDSGATSARKYGKKVSGGNGKQRFLGSLGGKGVNRIENMLDMYDESDLALRYLDDMVRYDPDSALKVFSKLKQGDSGYDVLKKVMGHNAISTEGKAAASKGKSFKDILYGVKGGEGSLAIPVSGSMNLPRGINALTLGGGLATELANMYGNGTDPLSAFVGDPNRIIANLVASTALRRPTMKAVASKRYGAMNTAQRLAANAQRMNYLNRLSQDQYRLDNVRTDDEIAALINGQAFNEAADREQTSDILRQIYGYSRR